VNNSTLYERVPFWFVCTKFSFANKRNYNFVNRSYTCGKQNSIFHSSFFPTMMLMMRYRVNGKGRLHHQKFQISFKSSLVFKNKNYKNCQFNSHSILWLLLSVATTKRKVQLNWRLQAKRIELNDYYWWLCETIFQFMVVLCVSLCVYYNRA
jgi:hypothetical protein